MVWHHVDPISLPLISDKEALVPPAVWPRVQAKAPNFAVDPLSSELSPVCPPVSTEPIYFALNPVTFVLCVVFPLVSPEPILLAALVSSFKVFVLPNLNTYAALGILEPLTFILAAVLMD